MMAKTWKKLLELPNGDEPGSIAFSVRTYSLAPIASRYYRIVLKPPVINPSLVAKGFTQQQQVRLAEAEFYSTPRVDRWEDKAAFGLLSRAEDTSIPSGKRSRCHREDGCRRSHIQNALRWNTQLDCANWELGHFETGVLINRRDEPSGHDRSYRSRSRQTQPYGCDLVFRAIQEDDLAGHKSLLRQKHEGLCHG